MPHLWWQAVDLLFVRFNVVLWTLCERNVYGVAVRPAIFLVELAFNMASSGGHHQRQCLAKEVGARLFGATQWDVVFAEVVSSSRKPRFVCPAATLASWIAIIDCFAKVGTGLSSGLYSAQTM